MGLILYHAWKSSASRRVRFFLEEKGLAYESHEIDLSRQEQHQPAFLDVNPLGVVPALIHNGRALHESGTICEYLDAVYPDPPLRPKDLYDLAQMRNWVRYVDGLIGNLIRFNWRYTIQERAAKLSESELQELLAKIPSADRREAWLRVARNPYTDTELDEARDALIGMLDRMDAMMVDGWLIKGGFSLADIAVAPFVRRIGEEIAPDEITQRKRPAVGWWWDRVQSRPAYSSARFDPFLA
ncbi:MULTISPECIES: glutathione S-transferase family protein [Roseobacteraceae]|uniref:Maleylpyruvate isomerase n=1 Tax=Pseudosulfitobacter pseudonitzschiae TaxID=1402135 RepID=A0A221JXB8_9RHOB|nr:MULTISPECIES: glutathione S-transferase family protein [Roseobacteraceae]ASM71333.1 maleylpyruvate isomerase [Pseudosulfitobacter pseudonitzschiae]